jgi:acetyl esterase/lipase
MIRAGFGRRVKRMVRTPTLTARSASGIVRLGVAAALLATPPLAGAQAARRPPSPTPPSTPYEFSAVDTAHGDREFHLLWPGGAPGALGTEAVDKPKITVYLAPAGRATGAAVVVCPGGGYHILAADHEGKQIALWLNSLGVSAFVLQYRLGERYRHPAPLQDAQRAIRMVRSRAVEWRVDPKRVGILGFSAGGHLASTAATHFDDGRADAVDPIERQGSRPDFAVLCYAVISLVDPVAHSGSRKNLLGDPADPALVELLSNEKQVTSRTPPTFLWHTADDAGVPVENSLLFFEALKKAGVPAELHVFPHGRHGLGLAPGDPVVSQWADLCARWLPRSAVSSPGAERPAVSGEPR